jgi:hypothetical protein
MHVVPPGASFLRREWRSLARLFLESCATGMFVSLVLALAVFVVATQARAAEPQPLFVSDMASTVEVARSSQLPNASLHRTEAGVDRSVAPAFAASATLLTLGIAALAVARKHRRGAIAPNPLSDPLAALERAVCASRSVC